MQIPNQSTISNSKTSSAYNQFTIFKKEIKQKENPAKEQNNQFQTTLSPNHILHNL